MVVDLKSKKDPYQNYICIDNKIWKYFSFAAV